MERPTQHQLREAMRPFLERSTWRGVVSLSLDGLVYGALVAGTLLLENPLLKLACAIFAGLQIATLFVVGHDAAHGSLTASRRLNALLGRIALLPAWHNYTLWQVMHQRLHHKDSNVQAYYNAWAPLSKAEYDALPGWRRVLERFYRSGWGFAPYYLAERWVKGKLFPRAHQPLRRRGLAWADFALVVAFALVEGAAAWYLGGRLAPSSPGSALLFAVALPKLVFAFQIGWSVYLHHIHPTVPWFRTVEQMRQVVGQSDVSVNVTYPRWYGFISHDIMEHSAHHVNALIPHYHLHAAQRRLNEMLGAQALVERFSLGWMLDVVRRCKLYDYDNFRWLDFDGLPTAPAHVPPALLPPSPAAEQRSSLATA